MVELLLIRFLVMDAFLLVCFVIEIGYLFFFLRRLKWGKAALENQFIYPIQPGWVIINQKTTAGTMPYYTCVG